MMTYVKATSTILIVEDSDDDFEFTYAALRESNLKNEIYRCIDGQDALDFLFHKNNYTKETAPKPVIILLDLNMPGLDGRDVLEIIKNDPYLKGIPVVVLTTSNDNIDVQDCYKRGANSYIQKPIDLDALFAAIKTLKDYWFEIAILPKDTSAS